MPGSIGDLEDVTQIIEVSEYTTYIVDESEGGDKQKKIYENYLEIYGIRAPCPIASCCTFIMCWYMISSRDDIARN